MRVRPDQIGGRSQGASWGFGNGRWQWGIQATPITPPDEHWGELTFRRTAPGRWVLGGFLASSYALGYRVVSSPVANMYTTPVQTPITGSSWDAEDQAGSKVAQLYGGYLLPGSRFGVTGGVGLVVSQWRTDTGWPYRAMQFKSTLKDTSKKPQRPDPINL